MIPARATSHAQRAQHRPCCGYGWGLVRRALIALYGALHGPVGHARFCDHKRGAAMRIATPLYAVDISTTSHIIAESRKRR